MSILIDETTKVIFQGFTGDKGTFHAKEAIEYGTNIVGGVTPGKGGPDPPGAAGFQHRQGSRQGHRSHRNPDLRPAPFAADAVMEAADAGLELAVVIAEGVPTQDMMKVKRYLLRYPAEYRMTVVGPNCAGVISVGKAMLGIMPPHIYTKGRIGIVARSGTLGYEAAAQMAKFGLGVSTSAGIGGDPINGSSFVDMLKLFEKDAETDAVMLIGEIGGPQEAEAAAYVRDHMNKPVVGFVAGLTAPPDGGWATPAPSCRHSETPPPRRPRSCGRREWP